ARVPGTYQASDVYVMHADGTGVQRLTRHEGWDGSPAWTPDGQAIVFYSEQDGEPRIFRMNRDGSASRATSAKGEPALSPTFTASGRLSFTSRRNGPVDDRLDTAGRVGPPRRERHRPRLLGARVRSVVWTPRLLWRRAHRRDITIRERPSGTVPCARSPPSR